MIGFAPVLRSVTVVAALGATTSKRTGATCRDAAEAPLAATQPGSKRTPKARDIFRVGAIVTWTLNVPVAVAASVSLQTKEKNAVKAVARKHRVRIIFDERKMKAFQ